MLRKSLCSSYPVSAKCALGITRAKGDAEAAAAANAELSAGLAALEAEAGGGEEGVEWLTTPNSSVTV